MVKITWTKKAVKDLNIIFEYISKDSEFYALNLINNIFRKIDVLQHHPRIGRIIPEKGVETLRELISGNYRIFYKINSPESVSVLRIHHSSRKVK